MLRTLRASRRRGSSLTLGERSTVPRRIAIISLLIAAVICAAMLLRRFHPMAFVFFAPAFLLPVLCVAFACSPKRKRAAAFGAMLGSLIASAGLTVGAILLSRDERLAHGMYGFFDFLAVALIASIGGCIAVAIGFGAGSAIAKVASP